jgi:O-antigen ligase
MRLQRLQLALVAATAAATAVSIFAAQLFFGLAVLVYLVRLASGATRWRPLPLDGPLLAFMVWTLLSASFSPDPLASHAAAKKLVLFALFYLAVDTGTDERSRERIVDMALLGAIALGAETVVQYLFLGFDTLQHRPTGFLGHYMTSSGFLAVALVLAAARLAFAPRWPRPERRDAWLLSGLVLALVGLHLVEWAGGSIRLWRSVFVAGLCIAAAVLAVRSPRWPGGSARLLLAAMAATLAIWALVVSQTRNAWLGAIFGLAVVLVLRAPRTLWLLPAGLLLLLALRPANLMARLTWSDASSIDRYYMWQAGLDMIRDKPVFGQGPGMILRTYPEYRWAQAPNPLQPHLHDNALQIAAELGLPALAFWLWMMALLVLGALREARKARVRKRFEAPAALGALATLIVAGVFEYNFGDSEVLMFTLIVTALPFAEALSRLSGGARGLTVPPAGP